MKQLRDVTQSWALRGGAVTRREPALLPFGTFSMVQNLRARHPGFVKRPGQAKQHTTADGTNKVLSLYQFRKSRIDEKHLYAQMSDGDVLEATTAPPGTTTGAFGSEVHDGSSGQLPASWATIDDVLIYSNGADQHQIYGGESSYVKKFIVFKGSADPKDVPEGGEDYSDEVSDGQTSTVAVLDSLSTWANWDAVFVCTSVPADALGIVLANGNDNASVLSLYYRKNDNTWADASATDGTDVGGDCLKQDGNITWTQPSDEIPMMMFGTVGFWYQIRVSAALDAEVEISGCTFQGPWTGLVNVWDGAPQEAIEVMVETGSASGKYYNYPNTAVDISSLASGAKIVLSATDPLEGIYIDIGTDTPHTGTAPTITVKYWNGSAFGTVGTVNDSTDGLYHSGWLRFPRKTDVQPLMFEGVQYYAYWYEITFNQAMTAEMNIGITVMPFFDITDFGNAGIVSSVWREHIAYTFDQFSEYIYVTPPNLPLVLSSDDSAVLETGDGRPNRILSAKSYYNNHFVWQEEKGVEGGTTTIFQGYDPTTYGKLVLSHRIGIVNSKSAVIVEGVQTSSSTQQPVETVAIWLSRYGVCMSNGKTIWIISDDIQNYFDPTESECIRRGYEDQHWLKHDSMFNVIRIGIVSGGSATVPNIFLVYDLTDGVWYFDVLGQELSCMEEIEAGSGDVPYVQIGGGVDDGFVYILNTGQNDVSTAINSYIDLELDYQGQFINLTELMFRVKAQTAGDITVTVDGNEIQAWTDTFAQTAEVTNQTIRRHWISTNVVDQHLTVRLQHNTASQDVYFEDIGMRILLWENR